MYLRRATCDWPAENDCDISLSYLLNGRATPENCFFVYDVIYWEELLVLVIKRIPLKLVLGT